MIVATCDPPEPEEDVTIECESSLATGQFALGSKCHYTCNYGKLQMAFTHLQSFVFATDFGFTLSNNYRL